MEIFIIKKPDLISQSKIKASVTLVAKELFI